MDHKELTPEAVMIELNRLKTDTYPTTDFYRRSVALERAKRAVRKTEIKMKPIPCFEGGVECSVCGTTVGDNDTEHYCFNCGQALDWGGDPDE